ncbi:hypothetical protein M9Y09_18375, partial [Clostridioides difficile]
VTLCENTNELGGILKGEQALPFKNKMYELGNNFGKIAKDLGVEVRLNTTVTKEYVENRSEDRREGKE